MTTTPITTAAPQPLLLDLLKSQTDEHHRHAETRPLQKMMAGGTIPREVYRRYMAQLLLVHRALDGWLAEAEAQRPALSSLQHTHHVHAVNLQADLVAMHAPDEERVPAAATQRFIDDMSAIVAAEPFHALSIFYVLEGSMNGNRHLAKALRRSFGEGEEGLSYLDPYGEAQRETWQGLRARANALDVPQDLARALVDTAQRTFQAISDISDEVLAVG